jgi:ATP-dependent helicase/nuclease subunit A
MYLRQMASYRAVLRSVFPDRPVCCALIWTRQARVVLLPDDLLDRHAPGHSSVET